MILRWRHSQFNHAFANCLHPGVRVREHELAASRARHRTRNKVCLATSCRCHYERALAVCKLLATSSGINPLGDLAELFSKRAVGYVVNGSRDDFSNSVPIVTFLNHPSLL